MIGERIRHARDYCGLTQTELADLAGLTQSKVSDIEASRVAVPKREDVVGIAQATGFPLDFFSMGPLPDLPEGNYRRLQRGKARATRQVRAQARQIVELVQRAESLITMPPVRVGPVADANELENVAAELREVAGVGARDPIPNLTRAVERAGVVVAALPAEIPDHYGFSAWPDFGLGGRPLIVFARSDPGDRQRFTVAHELGHLLLHSPYRDEAVSAKDAEREANRFAGALLLPAEAAREAMRAPLTLTTLAQIKATFGISIGACAERARALGFITAERHLSLRKQITSRGWHRNEPVPVPQEDTLLIRKVLDLMVEGLSVSERAESLGMPAFTYRSLAAAN